MNAIETLKTKVDALDFAVEKSMRYHGRMVGRYGAIHRCSMFITILSGSAAFADLAEMSPVFGAFAARDCII